MHVSCIASYTAHALHVCVYIYIYITYHIICTFHYGDHYPYHAIDTIYHARCRTYHMCTKTPYPYLSTIGYQRVYHIYIYAYIYIYIVIDFKLFTCCYRYSCDSCH